jgi:hypothetical protein
MLRKEAVHLRYNFFITTVHLKKHEIEVENFKTKRWKERPAYIICTTTLGRLGLSISCESAIFHVVFDHLVLSGEIPEGSAAFCMLWPDLKDRDHIPLQLHTVCICLLWEGGRVGGRQREDRGVGRKRGPIIPT